MRRLAFVFLLSCGHAAPRLDDRVEESARTTDPKATKVGAFLHGEKSSQQSELEWSVTLDPGCYWLIVVGDDGVTSLESSLEGRAVVSTQNEYCVPMTGDYRVSVKAKGHGAVSLGLYRRPK